MLVLSRKAEESLVINDNIVIVILAIEGDRVKIGIQAPPEVTILRSEVRDRLRPPDPNAPPTPPRRPRRPPP